MFNESSKVDIQKLLKLLFDKKYLILLFTFIVVISSNFYMIQVKDVISIKKIIVLNKNKTYEILEFKKINEEMKKFFSDYQFYNKDIEIRYFRLANDYRMELISTGMNEEDTRKSLEALMDIFNKNVTTLFLDKLSLEINTVYAEGSKIHDNLKILNNKLEDINIKVLKELEVHNYSYDALNYDNKLFKAQVLFSQLYNDVLRQNSLLLSKYNEYKKNFNNEITINDIFTFSEKVDIYIHNKMKFFILSLVFAFITSICVVTLFFNESSKVKND